MEQDLDYGSNINDSSERSDQVMSLSKTWQHCEVMGLSESCKISGRSGTMQNGTLFQLETSVLATSENESGLLPTPTANTYGSNQGGAAGRSGEMRYPLDTMAILGKLPTPTTFDSGNPLPPRKLNPSGGQKPPLVSVIGGKLNPEFVEFMMGYPQGHTSLIENNVLDSWEIL